MTHVLILDDDPELAQIIKEEVEDIPDTTIDVTWNSAQAREKVTRSILDGEPYDLFLIDRLLGDDEDGIRVMQQLKQVSPDTDAVVITGYAEAEQGIQAIRAGALRYMLRPYPDGEMGLLIESVRERRSTQREHKWDQIMRDTTEAALQDPRFDPVAECIVENSLRFGFQRAHLFWRPEHRRSRRNKEFIGIACAGENCIPDFSEKSFSLKEWFDLARMDQEFGLSTQGLSMVNREEAQASGYQVPRMDAVLLQLTQGGRFTGILLLDYDQQVRMPAQQEKLLLIIFSRQVSLLLSQAASLGDEKRKQRVSIKIEDISRKITSTAASGDPDDLMEEIHDQIGEVMDVSNYSIILYNKEKDLLDFQLTYRNDKKQKPHRPPAAFGLVDHLLKGHREALLIEDVPAYAREHQLDLAGPLPACWLGVPLRMSDQIIGAIVVHQMEKDEKPYREDDKWLLQGVADQIAGAIQSSRITEAERIDGRRMQVLQKASMAMLSIAQKDINKFWFTLVTIATSGFGLGFNRALLFRYDRDKDALEGITGVGTSDSAQARHDWERDAKRDYKFEDFLEDLDTKRMRHTPFEKLAAKMSFELSAAGNAINSVIHNGERLGVLEDHLVAELPPVLVNNFSLSTCAILPLRAGDHTVGIVIVDNKHNREPLDGALLDRLQTLLDISGLVWETIQQQEKSEDLLQVTTDLLTSGEGRALRDNLDKICQTARNFSGADWAVIFPLLPEVPGQFDLSNIGYAGSQPVENLITSNTHVGRISNHILHNGDLVVEDVTAHDIDFDYLHLRQHKFLKDQNVAALIGVKVYYRENDAPLGLLYLDYRQPRKFSKEDLRYAHSFAYLAGWAIFNRAEQVRRRRHLKTGKEIAETVGTGLNLEKSMEAILDRLHQVFEKTRLCILLYDHHAETLRFAPASFKYYRIRNPQFKKRDSFKLEETSIACQIARSSLISREVKFINDGAVRRNPDNLELDPRTQSELCISLLDTEKKLLGVLVLERNSPDAFNEDDVNLVQTVSQNLSTVIERAQQSEALDFLGLITAKTAWAADMVHEYVQEIGGIRDYAYLLSTRVADNVDLLADIKSIDQSAENLLKLTPRDDEEDQPMEVDAALGVILPGIVEQRDIELVWNPGAPGLLIEANYLDLRRIFMHLTRNAAREMKDPRKKKRIIVSTSPAREGQVKIVFEDTGPGIRDELRLSIFHRRIQKPGGGPGGHGLMIVRMLIHDMQGEIELSPFKRGRGAQFTILLQTVSPNEGEVE